MNSNRSEVIAFRLLKTMFTAPDSRKDKEPGNFIGMF